MDVRHSDTHAGLVPLQQICMSTIPDNNLQKMKLESFECCFQSSSQVEEESCAARGMVDFKLLQKPA
jgi:hypothetical protein